VPAGREETPSTLPASVKQFTDSDIKLLLLLLKKTMLNI
jgi:hypothetical protein